MPLKNLRTVGGRTLVHRAVDCAIACGVQPYVSTEDTDIAAHAASCGAYVHMRPVALAQDTTSTEAVITDWYRKLPLDERPDVIALLQPTSPLRTAADLQACIDAVVVRGYTAALTVTVSVTHHFQGRMVSREDGTRFMIPDRPLDFRPRSQDCRDRAHENGAVYVFTTDHYLATNNRLADPRKSVAVEMPEWRSIDVDSIQQLEHAEMLAKANWEML